MQSVLMRVDGDGVLWALTKCKVCGEVHKYLATDVVQGPVRCKSCSRQMSIDGATVEAAYADQTAGATFETAPPEQPTPGKSPS
jgi:hypothetical protein